MDEVGHGLLILGRQGHPALEAEQFRASRAQLLPSPFGMHDAAPGRHPVEFARPDRQLGSERVPVHDLAVEQVGDGRQADVGMGPHVHARSQQELGGTHLVEEDEGAHHLPLRGGQGSPHLEAAEIPGAGHDHGLDGVAGELVARLRIVGGVPTHQMSP
jgi:hypothetical protein